jgi:hypothetical protein
MMCQKTFNIYYNKLLVLVMFIAIVMTSDIYCNYDDCSNYY